MTISKDEFARERRGLDAANAAATKAQGALLDAAAEQADTAARLGARRRGLDALLSRRVFTVAGFSVATAAVLAACSGSAEESTPINGQNAATTVPPERAVSDAVLLRTASSLEHSVIAVYDTVAGQLSGATADLGKLFAEHHRSHAAAMEKATTDLGGEAYTKPNPVFGANVLAPAVAQAKTPAEILALAHALESVAAHTYQLLVAGLSVPSLRSAVMSIGGVEARHAALLAKALGAATVAGIDKLLPPATTTTAGKDTVVAPEIFQVPGAFEPLTASVVLFSGGDKSSLFPIDPLGPNSFMY